MTVGSVLKSFAGECGRATKNPTLSYVLCYQKTTFTCEMLTPYETVCEVWPSVKGSLISLSHDDNCSAVAALNVTSKSRPYLAGTFAARGETWQRSA